ncbi:uncharacterized protein C2orf50 homolog [Ornithorhynchus anatinus]|uniref:Ciliary microtubule inner protein 5 n=1 Tax=Ornithorhynchus anatinus TaxID=9258 RepID=F6YFP1_ORNAN|nr:uncharacterized protein C2orf50 homolog [Ornithorhynchus anatinus]
MGSRPTQARLATSAGYRLPEARLPVSASSLPPQGTRAGRTTALGRPQPARGREDQRTTLRGNQVLQDRLWRELLEAEWRDNQRWIQNWNFLKDYDPMGNKKEPQKLPKYIPRFSPDVPNTANQVIGSRINTKLGKKIGEMDFFLIEGSRKKKLDNEFQPS